MNVDKVFWFGGASWYVSTIFFCDIITPVVYWIGKKITNNFAKRYIIALIVVILYVAEFLIAGAFKGIIEAYTKQWWFFYVSPYRAVDYIIGMCTGILFAGRPMREIKIPKNAEYAMYTILEIGAFAGIFYVCKKVSVMPSSMQLGAAWTIPCLFLIVVIAEGKGLFSKLLTTRGFLYLGNLNYPMLMVHQVLFDWMQFLFETNIFYTPEMGAKGHWRSALVVFLVICVSDILNRLICTRDWHRSVIGYGKL